MLYISNSIVSGSLTSGLTKFLAVNMPDVQLLAPESNLIIMIFSEFGGVAATLQTARGADVESTSHFV